MEQPACQRRAVARRPGGRQFLERELKDVRHAPQRRLHPANMTVSCLILGIDSRRESFRCRQVQFAESLNFRCVHVETQTGAAKDQVSRDDGNCREQDL